MSLSLNPAAFSCSANSITSLSTLSFLRAASTAGLLPFPPLVDFPSSICLKTTPFVRGLTTSLLAETVDKSSILF